MIVISPEWCQFSQSLCVSAGVAEPRLLREVEKTLQQLQLSLTSRGCDPAPLIAFGHHPLSTIAHPHIDFPMRNGSQFSSAQHNMLQLDGWKSATLKELLSIHGVSMYLCGHLHDVFGSRLHRMHEREGLGSSNSFMAELELADWKTLRSLRLLAVDPQAGPTFVDLTFRRATHGKA